MLLVNLAVHTVPTLHKPRRESSLAMPSLETQKKEQVAFGETGGGRHMLFVVPASFLADVKSFAFPEVGGAVSVPGLL